MSTPTNDKGLLLEKAAQFSGVGLCRFNTTQVESATVLFRSAVEVSLTYNGNTKLFTSETVEGFTTKKEAERIVSGNMLADKNFLFHCTATNWVRDSTSIVSMSTSPSTSVTSFSDTPAIAPFRTASSIPALVPANPIGAVQELIVKKGLGSTVRYQTPQISPFVCTASIRSPVGEVIYSVQSAGFPKKKLAEHDAAQRLLSDPQFRAVIAGQPTTLPIDSLALQVENSTSAAILVPVKGDEPLVRMETVTQDPQRSDQMTLAPLVESSLVDSTAAAAAFSDPASVDMKSPPITSSNDGDGPTSPCPAVSLSDDSIAMAGLDLNIVQKKRPLVELSRPPISANPHDVVPEIVNVQSPKIARRILGAVADASDRESSEPMQVQSPVASDSFSPAGDMEIEPETALLSLADPNVLPTSNAPTALAGAESARSGAVSSLGSTTSEFTDLTPSGCVDNPKKIFHEKLVQLKPPRTPVFACSESSPFVCTLTLQPSSQANQQALLTSRSGPFSNKKSAEHAAAALMLQDPNFHALFSDSSKEDAVMESEESEVEGYVQCGHCEKELGSVNYFCFYLKTDTDREFIIKPEVAIKLRLHSSEENTEPLGLPSVKIEEREDSKTKEMRPRVVCLHCDTPIGHRMSTGPDGQQVCSIGGGKVIVREVCAKTWKAAMEDERLVDIARRTPTTFWGRKSTAAKEPERPVNETCVNFPKVEVNRAESADFQYSDLLVCKKDPKAEQVEGFHRCLEHHAIVVFPTGFGKTLVASMVMHRFRLLNPTKLVVMVEERITLVEQQSKVIYNDTDMSVCSLSGGNNTSYTLNQLLSGKFDALVVTAGVLHNLLDQELIRVSDFSLVVFDECHHTDKSHLYNRIIKKIGTSPLSLRPRVVGLTASPLSARNISDAYDQLAELRASFLEADVYRPKLFDVDTLDLVKDGIAVKLSEHQLSKQAELLDILAPLLKSLLRHLKASNKEEHDALIGGKSFVLSKDSTSTVWQRVVQCASPKYYHSDTQEAQALAARCRQLVQALNDNYLLGPAFVSRTVESTQSDLDEELISPQLRALCDILTERGESSCTLVFVDTRFLTNTVHKYLSYKYPALNCGKIVGQGGDDGMTGSKQSSMLADFRGGQCKLIVCTSVLEEGLDVRGCNLVIRLGGTPTLIRLVQSKGRARDKNGEMKIIFTVEERAHFEDLIKEERMHNTVLSGPAAHTANLEDRSYLKDFMIESERQRAEEAGADDDSVCSQCSQSDTEEKVRLEEEEDEDSNNTSEGVANVSGPRTHGLTMLICSNEYGLKDQIENNLLLQVGIVEGVTKSDVTLRGARSLVSDPRMFSAEDSLALVGIKSERHSFLRYFSSMYDFAIGSHPVYVLAPPSVKLHRKDNNSVADPVASTSKAEDTGPELLALPAFGNTHSTRMRGLQSVSTGWFVDRQHFLATSKLDASYDTVHIAHGRTLLLESVSKPENGRSQRTCIRVPAPTLGKHAIVCADKKAGTVTLYLTLTSAPSVFFEPKYKSTESAATAALGDEFDPFDIRKEFRVFVTNSANAEFITRDETPAQHDLRQLASAPVIALTFALDRWRRLMKRITDPAALALTVLITRVLVNECISTSLTDLKLPSLNEGPPDLVESAKECHYTYATLVSDVYCGALHPPALTMIKIRIESANSVHHFRVATAAMMQLHKHLQLTSIWQDAYDYFEKACAVLESNIHCDSGIRGGDPALHDGYVMMKRIIITPSRLMLMPAVQTKTNRLIRAFGGRFQLIYVKFRDEQGQGMYNQGIYDARFKDMFINGFFLCGMIYEFLLCSASQLREQTAVFFDGSWVDVVEIRGSIIPDITVFKIKNDIAKFISRLGLMCTADTDTGVALCTAGSQIENAKSMMVIDDVKTHPQADKKAKLLTDGAGWCTVEAMKLFQAEHYALRGYYSPLIQIRAGGCKGTLLCDPDLATREEGAFAGVGVVFRNSMKKFDTDFNLNMCVVKVAEFAPLTLNREVITLLSAIRVNIEKKSWNPHGTYFELLDEALKVLGQMLIDPSCALERLTEFFPAKQLAALIESGVNLLSEPLLKSMLHEMFNNDARSLRCKTHIPVQHGTLAMGAPDPTGLLQDGEIFLCVHRPKHVYRGLFDANGEYKIGGITLVRITDHLPEDRDPMCGQDFETFVIVGEVLMYRNPCLDPGDLRVVNAVNRPELYFWKNALLLPASDRCLRSLSAECSGGDLDGDMFGVIWDHRLVPPHDIAFNAVDYDEVAATAKEQQGEPAAVDWSDAAALKNSIAQFVTRTMCNVSLGKTAVLHVALSDILLSRPGDGAGNPLAREVAKAQSLAVDYPKTGIAPTVPPAAKKKVRECGRPHFMEKPEMKQYLSHQSLGTIYDVVSTVTVGVEIALSKRNFTLDSRFVVNGSEAYRPEAEVVYADFALQVQSLMQRFSLESEAEMVMGVPRNWADEFSLDHEGAAQSLAASWATLKNTFKKSFYINLPDGNRITIQQKASAWYQVSYASKERYHSFAWILIEHLSEICQAAAVAVEALRGLGGNWAAHSEVVNLVGKSAWKSWRKGYSMVWNAILQKEIIFEKVRDAILNSDAVKAVTHSSAASSAADVQIHSFGSTVLLLCDLASDLDLTVNFSQFAHQDAKTVLENFVYPAVNSIAASSQSISNASIPLVKIVVEDGYGGTPVDISAQNMSGVHKSRLIRNLYSADPMNLLVFSSLVQWARACGMIRGFVLEERTPLLNSGELQALILNHLLDSRKSPMSTNDELNKSDQMITSKEILAAADRFTDLSALGETLMSFFVRYSELRKEDKDFTYIWPIEGEPVHLISAKRMEEVRDNCRRALLCLAISSDWGFLLENSAAFERSRTTIQLELSAALSREIAPSKGFWEIYFHWKSKAQVRISTCPSDPTKLVVQGSGRYQQIQILRQELLRKVYSGRMVSYGAVRTMSSPYFMEGSSFLYARGAETKETMLEVTPVMVDRYLVRQIHAGRAHSTLKLSNVVLAAEDKWTAALKVEFCRKMMEQMAQLGKVSDAGQVIFSVHLGKLLLLDAATSFERARGSRSCTELEEAMNNNQKRQKIRDTSSLEAEKKAAQQQNPPSRKSKPAGAKGALPRVGTSGAPKEKKTLTSTFVSGVPIMPDGACIRCGVEGAPGVEVFSSDKVAATLASFNECIVSAQEKFAQILGALSYVECDLNRIPITKRADVSCAEGTSATGSAWRIPGSTLTVPTGEWRTAVDVTETEQLNVDLGPNGEIRDVVERFVSFVNGTLVDPATQKTPCAAQETTKAAVYSFQEHDLRVKFGTMRPVSSERSAEKFAKACPDGQPPIEFYPSSELVDMIKDGSAHGGVTSELRPTEYLQARILDKAEFTCVRPSSRLKTPESVSFARHVVHRRAFFSPEMARTVTESAPDLLPPGEPALSVDLPHDQDQDLRMSVVDAAPAVPEAARRTTAKVMAVMATGEHFEGAGLLSCNPFVDISLEVDATQLIAAMETTREASSEDDEEGKEKGEVEVDPLSSIDLHAHICDIVDELLRVSAQIKRYW